MPESGDPLYAELMAAVRTAYVSMATAEAGLQLRFTTSTATAQEDYDIAVANANQTYFIAEADAAYTLEVTVDQLNSADMIDAAATYAAAMLQISVATSNAFTNHQSRMAHAYPDWIAAVGPAWLQLEIAHAADAKADSLKSANDAHKKSAAETTRDFNAVVIAAAQQWLAEMAHIAAIGLGLSDIPQAFLPKGIDLNIQIPSTSRAKPRLTSARTLASCRGRSAPAAITISNRWSQVISHSALKLPWLIDQPRSHSCTFRQIARSQLQSLDF
ncbi:MAG: hypothetical protein O3A00_19830 [Planctomycetota bacterium]|nr:hypothetical protein [Planctomycetota bacterium]